MSTKIVTINLGAHEYDIYIGEGLLARARDVLPTDIEGANFFLITDENVREYAASLEMHLKAYNAADVHLLSLPAGESTKSFKYFQHVCEWLLDKKIARDSIVIAIGGGVIGDLAGYCAASALRGVSFVQVPTTVLSQVDNSVGGKTGINTRQGKNLVGAFYQPDVVIADIGVLKTLPNRELLAGYAEIVKYGLIGDLNFFEWLEENGKKVCSLEEDELVYAIEKSVRAKADVVIADEKEKGQRALLNLGHTFGHVLEAAAGYDGRLLHGEAVSIGMVMAFNLSYKMGLVQKEEVERVEEHLMSVGLPTRASAISPALRVSADSLIEMMHSDKKVKRGKINFILARRIGNAFVSDDVPLYLVKEVLIESLGETETKTLQQVLQDKWKSAFSSLS